MENDGNDHQDSNPSGTSVAHTPHTRRVRLHDPPPREGFFSPRTDNHEVATASKEPHDQDDRSPGPHRLSGERRGRHRLRGAGRSDPPGLDPLLDSPIRHILARHEQGRTHGGRFCLGHRTGRVCIATSGPGATNLVTPLADALMDSVPLVAITGQVPTTSVGNDAFQEAHTTGITMPATKHDYFVTDPNDIANTIHEAFHIASTGRPGPVLVDLPKDILNQTLTWTDPKTLNMPGYKPTVDGHPRRIKEAVELIAHAKRPVLYVGGGVIKANGSKELRKAGRTHRGTRSAPP